MLLLFIALDCCSYAETAQCWAPLRIGLKGLNAFCWGRASIDHSLHALWRSPLAFVSTNNDGTGVPQPGRDHCSVRPMGMQQIDVYVLCEFLCICVCMCRVMQRWMHMEWMFLSHQAFRVLCDEGEGDVTQGQSQSDISSLDLCQGV